MTNPGRGVVASLVASRSSVAAGSAELGRSARGFEVVKVRRIVPNVSADDPDFGREFFAGLLGLEVRMNLGWIVTYVSPTDPTAQVSVLRPGPLVPALAVAAEDMDAVHRRVVAVGHRVLYPLTDEPWGVRRFFVAGPGGIAVNVIARPRLQPRPANLAPHPTPAACRIDPTWSSPGGRCRVNLVVKRREGRRCSS